MRYRRRKRYGRRRFGRRRFGRRRGPGASRYVKRVGTRM